LPLLSFYKNLGYKIEDVPNAYAQYQNEISLPVYFDLSDEDTMRVAETVWNAIQEAR
jgi:dTDP-4-amino-4,6-dideoxygalactose transaminase